MTEVSRKPLDLEMSTDYRAHYVEPGTLYLDEPSEEVPPGWYVLGDRSDEEYGYRTIVKVEQAFDGDDNDVTGEFAKKLATLINLHTSWEEGLR